MMRRQVLMSVAAMLWAARLAAQGDPVVDHHQHLISPAIASLLATDSGGPEPITARDLVALLDSAGIRRALVLSVAYMYCSPNSDVQLENPAHLEQLRRVFRAANERRMAIVVHMRASISRKRPYGTAQARIFLKQLLPLVPDVPVQIAHLAGTGPGYDDPPAHSAMAVLAGAVEREDPRTRRLWFDVTTVADRDISPVNAAKVVQRIRQVSAERILYGSDAAIGDNLRPHEGWAAFRRWPLTASELDQIARNVAPHLR